MTIRTNCIGLSKFLSYRANLAQGTWYVRASNTQAALVRGLTEQQRLPQQEC